MLSADILCKQFESRLGPMFCHAWSGFDTNGIPERIFFKNWKNSADNKKKHAKLPRKQSAGNNNER